MLDPKGKGPIVLLILSISAIFLSGLFFGFTYYIVGLIQTALESVVCEFPSYMSYTTCQDWFTDTIFKFLDLKVVLINFSYFFIFTLVIGMLLVGYQTGANPVLMGIYWLCVLLITYSASLLSNLYRNFLTNPIAYSIMQPMTIYNKIMLNFPMFVGFTGLIAICLGVVNYQRTKINTPDPISALDY